MKDEWKNMKEEWQKSLGQKHDKLQVVNEVTCCMNIKGTEVSGEGLDDGVSASSGARRDPELGFCKGQQIKRQKSQDCEPLPGGVGGVESAEGTVGEPIACRRWSGQWLGSRRGIMVGHEEVAGGMVMS